MVVYWLQSIHEMSNTRHPSHRCHSTTLSLVDYVVLNFRVPEKNPDSLLPEHYMQYPRGNYSRRKVNDLSEDGMDWKPRAKPCQNFEDLVLFGNAVTSGLLLTCAANSHFTWASLYSTKTVFLQIENDSEHAPNTNKGPSLTANNAEQRGSQCFWWLWNHWEASFWDDQRVRRRRAFAASAALKLPYLESRAAEIKGGSSNIKEWNGKLLVLRYQSSAAHILHSWGRN